VTGLERCSRQIGSHHSPARCGKGIQVNEIPVGIRAAMKDAWGDGLVLG
jgi:hypothetical protein